MAGPIGPPGFNGSQGPAGPAGSVGPKGPKGAGDFSACKYQVVSDVLAPGVTDSSVGKNEENVSMIKKYIRNYV